MNQRGNFLRASLVKDEKPAKHFGELVEIRPRGFKKSVQLALYRDTDEWAAVHFPTGVLIKHGPTKQAATTNAEVAITSLKDDKAFVPPEELFDALVAKHPVINTQLESPYQGPKKS
jgi:hypothetical protein